MSTMLESTRSFFDDLKSGNHNLVDCQTLYKNIGAGEDMFILDIRKAEDYEGNFIEGAIHCEWEEVIDLMESGELPKDKKVIVVCYTGQTAGQMTGILRILGYDACSLMGGMVNGWARESMPYDSSCVIGAKEEEPEEEVCLT